MQRPLAPIPSSSKLIICTVDLTLLWIVTCFCSNYSMNVKQPRKLFTKRNFDVVECFFFSIFNLVHSMHLRMGFSAADDTHT